MWLACMVVFDRWLTGVPMLTHWRHASKDKWKFYFPFFLVIFIFTFHPPKSIPNFIIFLIFFSSTTNIIPILLMNKVIVSVLPLHSCWSCWLVFSLHIFLTVIYLFLFYSKSRLLLLLLLNHFTSKIQFPLLIDVDGLQVVMLSHVYPIWLYFFPSFV